MDNSSFSSFSTLCVLWEGMQWSGRIFIKQKPTNKKYAHKWCLFFYDAQNNCWKEFHGIHSWRYVYITFHDDNFNKKKMYNKVGKHSKIKFTYHQRESFFSLPFFCDMCNQLWFRHGILWVTAATRLYCIAKYSIGHAEWKMHSHWYLKRYQFYAHLAFSKHLNRVQHTFSLTEIITKWFIKANFKYHRVTE